MGIPKLNSYLVQNCSKQSIDKKHLSTFSGKTIAIDISIYLYKFAANNGIIPSLYQMIRTFKFYNITPIFVFDGKPPEEKKELIYKRNDLRYDAEMKCIELQNEYDTLDKRVNKTREEIEHMLKLKGIIEKTKKQCVRVSWNETENAKKLLKLCNIDFYIADGEADQLCVQLVLNKTAWACMSDDMDMFVYGCTRVMRGLSLYNHTVMFYNINGILRELDIKMVDFRKIAVLSGTDYNIENNINIKDVIRQYNIYKKTEQDVIFYVWYAKLRNIEIDLNKLNKIYDMFCIDNGNQLYNADYSIKKKNTIETFLRPYGFVFA
jgi:flap endonuclease-1